ncbi:ABC transporter ATP-binding protein [Psychroflexus planctonicus]|uniref:Xenobiotic ABC transporter ATP-binding protein n=1 Tax=Psychroflexus planctonicus TaxID=1526575 RepID=A0ABQ1SD62_9FLAO|nr:ABC transporter ATP-binding protein [Psychroflexus planctonicus]GGE26914.1 xenobiotic ABC transporter ATP-binding protein [Psychroflexus planctonicus]
MSKSKSGNAFDFKLFKRLLKFTNPYKLTFVYVVFAAIALSIVGLVRPYLLKLIIDDAITPKDHSYLVELISWMLAALIAEVIFQLSFIYYANWLGQEVIRDIRIQLFRRMMSFKKKYFDTSAIGRLVTRAVGDIETIASIFSQGLFMIMSDILKMGAILIFLFYQSWELTLIVLALFPLIIIATRIFQRKMKGAFEIVRNQVANLNSFVQERITGMKIVQIFNREEKEFEDFKEINKEHRKGWIKTVWYNSIYFAFVEMITSITIGLLIWYGGIRIIGSEVLSIGLIIMFIEYAQQLFRPLRQIADKFNSLQMGMVAANRVFSILDTSSFIKNEGKRIAKNIEGKLSFEDVVFGYNADETVIKGINFKVNPGETIAIVGATGAGKSTIINLLSRFYEINSGRITVDGVDIKEYELASLRKEISVVLQDVFLFADSILNNITLQKKEISREEVVLAAQEIGVAEFIETLPGSYDYNVKERGAMLSSGQRQLIAFLRAYVNKPSILVLDEATSSIDSYSEQLIQKATEKITKGRTSIVIAHRLATIKNADKIIVMEAGKIVEEGKHDELLKKASGHYKNLYEAQFKEEELAN